MGGTTRSARLSWNTHQAGNQADCHHRGGGAERRVLRAESAADGADPSWGKTEPGTRERKADNEKTYSRRSDGEEPRAPLFPVVEETSWLMNFLFQACADWNKRLHRKPDWTLSLWIPTSDQEGCHTAKNDSRHIRNPSLKFTFRHPWAKCLISTCSFSWHYCFGLESIQKTWIVKGNGHF